jgi:hypothetical protein
MLLMRFDNPLRGFCCEVRELSAKRGFSLTVIDAQAPQVCPTPTIYRTAIGAIAYARAIVEGVLP